MGKRAHQERLRDPGDPLKEHVPARQQANEQGRHRPVLPNDCLADLCAHGREAFPHEGRLVLGRALAGKGAPGRG
ncbi:hypothetical protein GCM10010407_01770 [Rarobacter incanus]